MTFFVGRGEETDDGVHVGGGEGAPRLVVDNLLDAAVFEEELLKVFAVADIQPRIGGDETERAVGVEEGKSVEVEVDVEVALGADFARDSDRRIFRFDVLFAFVAEEAREGLIHGAGKFRFVGFLVSGCNVFARDFRIGDVLLPHVRRVADDDIESAFIIGEDFNEGDVPDKR